MIMWVKLNARSVRFRDLALTIGAGDWCPDDHDYEEEGLVVIGLHTGYPEGLATSQTTVSTKSAWPGLDENRYTECYGWQSGGESIYTIEAPSRVRARGYATIVDGDNGIDELEGVGTIDCPSDFDIETTGVVGVFNLTDFLHDC